MSQRNALVISLAITLLVGIGIVAGRSQLLDGGNNTAAQESSVRSTATTVNPGGGVQAVETTDAIGVRVVQVTLPTPTTSEASSVRSWSGCSAPAGS